MGDFLELNSFILAFSLYWFVFILTLIHFHESNTRRNFSYTLDIPSKFRASFELAQKATLDLSVIGHLKGDTVSPLCVFLV